jgi:hypothetical protein
MDLLGRKRKRGKEETRSDAACCVGGGFVKIYS